MGDFGTMDSKQVVAVIFRDRPGRLRPGNCCKGIRVKNMASEGMEIPNNLVEVFFYPLRGS